MAPILPRKLGLEGSVDLPFESFMVWLTSIALIILLGSCAEERLSFDSMLGRSFNAPNLLSVVASSYCSAIGVREFI